MLIFKILWIVDGYAINKACPLGEKLMNMKRRRPNEIAISKTRSKWHYV